MTPTTAPPQPRTDRRPAPPGPAALVVRRSGGAATRHPLGAAPVTAGGPDCDVPLPGAPAGPLGRFTRTPDGVAFERLAPPGFPVLLNGDPFSGPAALLRHGDALALGAADVGIAVADAEPAAPAFVPFDAAHDEREELARLRRELERAAAELEADRAAWYRRRSEIDAEIEEAREDARARRELLPDETALAAREAEVARAGAELATIRQSLVEQYQARRDELTQMQDVVRGAAAELEGRRVEWLEEVRAKREELEREAAERRAAWEAAAAERWRDLEARFDLEVRQAEPRLAEVAAREERLSAVAAEVNAARDAVEHAQAELERQRELDVARLTDAESRLSRRADDLDRREGDLARRESSLIAERDRLSSDRLQLDRDRDRLADLRADLDRRANDVNLRTEQLARDAGEAEDHLRLMEAEQAEHRAAGERLDRRRADLDGRDEELAERAGQVEAQQAMLAVLRARLERDGETLRRELAQLAADRLRAEEARAETQAKLRDAEQAAAELSAVRSGQEEQTRALVERRVLIDAATEALRDQQDAVAARLAELASREAELDARSAEIAEQAATLKGRLQQTLDLQARLEADRAAVRERESGLTGADAARLQFQEQLRKRAEELAARARHFDEEAARIAEARREQEAARAAWDERSAALEAELAAAREEVAARTADAERQAAQLAEREAALARQIERLREAGRAAAAGRKQFAEARSAWQSERAAGFAEESEARQSLAEYRNQLVAEVDALRREAPELESRVEAARGRIEAARDTLRAQLAELHQFAAQSRAELEGVREHLRTEGESLREREQTLETARADHRLASTQFRQQLIEWQAKIAELKATAARDESKLGLKQAEVAAAAQSIDENARELARKSEELERERRAVAERRADVERHLSDMREWYRRKLRELAKPDGVAVAADPNELDPGDRQLGELLRRLELVDAETLDRLWGESQRQRRTLRQVLLASGAVTLYQLALIEAGNLDALMVGRFRVVDRLRVTPRETLTKIVDPARIDGASRGIYLLRHLGEAEAADAVRPDEYRQRFLALQAADSPHLERVAEVLDVAGRPAVLVEWLAGLPSGEWPAGATSPGAWLRLLLGAARGVAAAHHAGLVHGRLTADRLLLTADGAVKCLGFGEPHWLQNPSAMGDAAEPAVDLRALGRLAGRWAQAAGAKKRGRGKAFPDALSAVLKRLEADPAPPMGDTGGITEPFADADELVRTLETLEAAHPCPAAEWDALLALAAESPAEAPRARLSA